MTRHTALDAMKTLNVRELRQSTPTLKRTLETEGELLLVSNGEPIARLLPVRRSERPKLPSLKAFRDSQPQGRTPLEELVRQDRDSR